MITTTQITTYREQIAAGNWTCIDVLAMLDEIERRDCWNRAAEKLPEGWEVQLGVLGASGGYCFELFDHEGTKHEFPTDCENIEQQVDDAIEYAIENENKKGGHA